MAGFAVGEVGFLSGARSAGFREIAKRAGVSVSTVDRVLNERGSVSVELRHLVISAARELGVKRILPVEDHGTTRIEVILPLNRPGNSTPFWDRLDNAVQQARAGLPTGVIVHRTRIPEGDIERLKSAILTPPVRRNALVIAPDFSNEISDALQEITARGEHLITLVADTPKVADRTFAGVDNVAMGRTAGFLMNGILKGDGEILLLRVSPRRREQVDRSEGFLAAFGSH